MSKLIVSLSPHAHGNDSVERNMYGVIIALIPALLVSLIGFGLGSLVVLASSIAACVFFEWSITKYILKKEPSILDGRPSLPACCWASTCLPTFLYGLSLLVLW